MKQEEIKIRRLMQKCEDWLSDKINSGADNKWWRLDQVSRSQLNFCSVYIYEYFVPVIVQYIVTLDSRIKQLEESERCVWLQ